MGFYAKFISRKFYDVDNFCIEFENYCKSHFLKENSDCNFAM